MKFPLTNNYLEVGNKIDEVIKAVLESGTNVNYATTASNKASSDTLTLKDVRRAVKTIRKSEKEWEESVRKMTSDPEWEATYLKLHKMSWWLYDTDRLEDYRVVYLAILAISPNTFSPIHIKTKERLLELWDEYDKLQK